VPAGGGDPACLTANADRSVGHHIVTDMRAHPSSGGLTWSADGRRLFFMLGGGGSTQIASVAAEGGPVRFETRGDHELIGCSVDPRAGRVACVESDPLTPGEVAVADLGDAPARRYIEACKGWPRADVTVADRAPVASSVPVLLLSGEFDPVTPPSNAAAAAASLPNSFQVVVPGEGHGALSRSCTRRIVDDFVRRASVTGLSADCIQDAAQLRFFTSFTGPQP